MGMRHSAALQNGKAILALPTRLAGDWKRRQ
jgi:hypothetical protein